MLAKQNNWLVVVMMLPLTRQVSDAISVDDRCDVCPSYCDDTGLRHEGFNCRLIAGFPSSSSSYCCNFVLRLSCCTNETLMISKKDVHDDFGCSVFTNRPKYGRTTLFVCVPVGLTCFVVAAALFVYQRRKRRLMDRNNHSQPTQRRPSIVSCSSGGTQIQYPMETVCDVNNANLRQPTVVMTIADLQTIGAVPAAAPTTDIVYAIPSGVHPPPYTDDTPPSYFDIFPS